MIRFADRTGVLFAALALGCFGLTESLAAAPAEPSRLKVSENGRFLVQQDGSPFFWLADTGWYLWKLNQADVELYLSDRTRKGFNVVQVHCGYDVTSFDGNRPFAGDNTDTPNESFWRNLDWAVAAAGKHGLRVALVPIWGTECVKAFAGDAEKARRLGKWLGARYGKHSHVVWAYRDVKRPRGGADVARRKAYWAVFAGAFGHTYGHNDVCVFWKPGDPTEPPTASGQRAHWRESLQAPGADQMRHLRGLMEARPFLNRIPDQSLLASPAGTGIHHVRATRASDGGYAMIYVPTGSPVAVKMDKISGIRVKASWFDPRTGRFTHIGSLPNRGSREFDAPGPTAAGNDWVLVLDAEIDQNRSTSVPRWGRFETTVRNDRT